MRHFFFPLFSRWQICQNCQYGPSSLFFFFEFTALTQSSKRFTFNKSYPNIITMVTEVPGGPGTINTNCCSGWSLDRLLVMAIKDGAPSGEVAARAARFPEQIFHLRQQIKAKSLSVSSSAPPTTLKTWICDKIAFQTRRMKALFSF